MVLESQNFPVRLWNGPIGSDAEIAGMECYNYKSACLANFSIDSVLSGLCTREKSLLELPRYVDFLFSVWESQIFFCHFLIFIFIQFVESVAMAKSKNHTNHNQNRKAHRNGIPRPKKSVYKQMSLKGVDPKVSSREIFSNWRFDSLTYTDLRTFFLGKETQITTNLANLLIL